MVRIEAESQSVSCSHTHQSILESRSGRLCEVAKLIIVKALKVLLIEEDLDALLDVSNLGDEAALDLVDGLAKEEGVLHLLARLHDTHDSGLRTWLVTVPATEHETETNLNEHLAIFFDCLVLIIPIYWLIVLGADGW